MARRISSGTGVAASGRNRAIKAKVGRWIRVDEPTLTTGVATDEYVVAVRIAQIGATKIRHFEADFTHDGNLSGVQAASDPASARSLDDRIQLRLGERR